MFYFFFLMRCNFVTHHSSYNHIWVYHCHSYIDGKYKDYVLYIWCMHLTNMHQTLWARQGVQQSRIDQFCVLRFICYLEGSTTAWAIILSSFFPSFFQKYLQNTWYAPEPLIHSCNAVITKTVYGLICFVMTSERGEEEVEIVSWYHIAYGWNSKLNFTWIYQPHKYNSDLVLSLGETGVTRL